MVLFSELTTVLLKHYRISRYQLEKVNLVSGEVCGLADQTHGQQIYIALKIASNSHYHKKV